MFWRAQILAVMAWGLAALAGESPLESKQKVVALIFVSSECPISNKLAPEIERLSKKFPTNEVSLLVVYPNKSDTDELVAKHRKDYRLTGKFVRDPGHDLVRKAGVTVTPEAAVFDAQRNEIYRGRINDQFLGIGKGRPQPTVHDLEEAIATTLAGQKPKLSRTEAVGCYIQEE